MNNIHIKIYKSDTNTGTLTYVSEGVCLIYVPEGTLTEPYVSLNFGTYHLHLNLEDFKNFVKSM